VGYRLDDHDGAVPECDYRRRYHILGMAGFIGQSKNSPGDSAMIILRERFAWGEFEMDVFETKKPELG
jgi:uncharacterized membrane protein